MGIMWGRRTKMPFKRKEDQQAWAKAYNARNKLRIKRYMQEYRKEYMDRPGKKEANLLAQKHYLTTGKGKAVRLAYRQSEGYKAIVKRYRLSSEGKLAHKQGYARYMTTKKGKETVARHRATEKGRATMRRAGRKFDQSVHGELARYSYHLKTKHGITLAQYQLLVREQDGKCAICGETDINGKRLAVDHDHKTGKIRGLLCTKHNTALGLLGDDLAGVKRAYDYLRKRAQK